MSAMGRVLTWYFLFLGVMRTVPFAGQIAPLQLWTIISREYLLVLLHVTTSIRSIADCHALSQSWDARTLLTQVLSI